MTDPATQITSTSLDPDAGVFQSLRRELGVSSFGINAMTLEPKQRLRVHRHERQEEVYLVLEGELTLVVEGEKHAFGAGSLVRVPPQLRRQLTNPGGERVRLLALGGDGEHRGRDGLAWDGWDDEGEGRDPKEIPLPGDLPD